MHRYQSRCCQALFVAAITLCAITACSDGPTNTPTSIFGLTLRVVSGDGQSGEVATALRDPLVVSLTDSLGRGVAGVAISFSGDIQEQSSRTNDQGIASARWQLLSVAGTQRAVARAMVMPRGTANPSTEFTATAVAGPAARLDRITRDNEVAVPGTTLDTVVVAARDRFGNITSAGVTWTVTRGGGSVRIPSIADQLSAIRAIWTLGSELGEQELTASAASVGVVFRATASAPFVVTHVVVGGGHACALSTSGVAYCWGDNQIGQLGAPYEVAQKSPVRVGGGHTFTSITAGAIHTCGLTGSGDAYCWGWPFGGPSGATAQRVGGAPGFASVTAGGYHACGLTKTGRAYCWGDNALGQLGDSLDRSTPGTLSQMHRQVAGAVSGDLAFVSLAASYYTTCGISTAGATYCWGGNWERTLGGDVSGTCRMAADPYYEKVDYDAPCRTTPTRVMPQFRFTSLAASGYAFCGVTTNAELVCWGHNLTSPQVVSSARFSRVWVVGHHACGIEVSGRTSCWNAWRTPSSPSAPPYGGEGLTLLDISASGGTACGIASGPPGIAYCWGGNHNGHLGDGTKYHRDHAAPVVAPPGT